jgi:uncharacterized membrane protein
MERFSQMLVGISAFSALLIAGVFFAFSNFIMAALTRLAPGQGMSAMNAINVTVINPLFMALFLGTGLIGAALIVAHISGLADPAAMRIMAGALVYIVGVIGVTMMFNVPMNNALAAAIPIGPEGAAIWARYLSGWTFWNHVRTIAALVSGSADSYHSTCSVSSPWK